MDGCTFESSIDNSEELVSRIIGQKKVAVGVGREYRGGAALN